MISKITSFFGKMLSTTGEVSFGRCAAAAWSIFYAVQHSWVFHRTGHLVDNTTVVTHLGVVTTLYGLGKVNQLGGGESK